jgi:carbonic anhydrase
MALEDLLVQNQKWAAGRVAVDPEFFRRHVASQEPRLLWIGCSDSRVPAEQVLNCGLGELFVHRNVANVVAYNDVNIATVIQYAVENLKVNDVVVCGHYGCGGVAAACSDKALDGYLADWLMVTTSARRRVEERLAAAGKTLPRDEFLRLVVEENVRLQAKHLCRLGTIRRSWLARSGFPYVHGWVYDIANGLVTQVMEPVNAPTPEVP